MSRRRRRTIPGLLAAATLIPSGALVWLGLRILQQDRDLERQRRRESLDVAAGRLALAIERRLGEIEEQLAQGRGVRLTAAGLEPGPGVVVLYQPAAGPVEGTPAAAFAEAEALEFGKQDLAGATAAYRRLADSGKPAVRAAALVRLGRALRKKGERPGALAAYGRLEELGSETVEGQPAALLARQARCRLHEEAGDAAALRKDVAELARGLYSGVWRMDRGTFELYRDMVGRWGGPAPPVDAVVRTDAAIVLWNAWQAGDLAPRGRRVLGESATPVLALWTGEKAWLATLSELEALLRPLWKEQRLEVSLGDPPREGAVVLTPAETRLPFILRVASAPEPAGGNGYRTRRTLLVTGLLLTFALILAAGYGLYRATTREMALVRQQSEFISAVSHEFRTPLTSMRHLTDMLVSRSVPSEDRKAQYYELLARETERLHRMVESLLSFGRMEAGAYAWHLEPVDACELARGVVEEFRAEPLARDRHILWETEDHLPPIRADRDALARALWNLLENAAKYSEPESPIRVFVRRAAHAVLLGVEDRGPGIPPAESERIFQKFVRGSEARRAGVGGVGIGLALVKRIVEAHGGSVDLKSEPGRGSTFTLVLPCRES